MASISRAGARLALAAAAATGLVATGVPGAQAALHEPGTAAGVTTLRVAITDNDMIVEGPTTLPAGRVKVTLENARVKHQASTEIGRLAPGFSFHDFRTDVKRLDKELFGPHGNKKKGLKALNDVIDHVTIFGGFVTGAGTSEHGTLLVTPGEGQYFIWDDSHSAPQHRHPLTVTSGTGPQALPAADATVTAKTNRRFGGDKVLPATGDITFHNESTESPHFLTLLHVKKGTSRKQVIKGLENNDNSRFLRDEQDVDIVTSGQAMRLHVHLPAGRYAELCFFPDPKTGMPHAFMGMVRIVHLK